MSTIRPLWLLLICGLAAVAGWVAQNTTARSGLAAPVLHWSSLITMGAVVVVTLGFGLRVQRYKTGKLKKRIDPIQAARTLVLAQASAYAGAVIAGWHLGILLDLLGLTGAGSETTVSSFVMVAAGIVMVTVGWVVEQFCRLPPEDPSAPGVMGAKGEEEGYAAGAG